MDRGSWVMAANRRLELPECLFGVGAVGGGTSPAMGGILIVGAETRRRSSVRSVTDMIRSALDPLCHRILMPVRLRADSDLSSCVRIAEEVHRLDGYPVYRPADLRQFLASSDALAAWVAEEHGDIVGHVALHQRSSASVLALASGAVHHPADRFGVIARLLVAPAARRMGIGRLLLETATVDSLRRGLWPILDVVTQHRGAIMLYEQAGWVRAGQVTTKFGDGKEMEEFVFLGPRPTTP